MKPKILICGEEGWARNIPHVIINLDYGRLVSQAGGLPIVAIHERCICEYARICDGLFLTDGPFVHVGKYGEYYKTTSYPELARRREIMEFALVNKMIEMGKPVFGVNRGMNVINVALGGTLRDDGTTQFVERTGVGIEILSTTESGKVKAFRHKKFNLFGTTCAPDRIDKDFFDEFIKAVKK